MVTTHRWTCKWILLSWPPRRVLQVPNVQLLCNFNGPRHTSIPQLAWLWALAFVFIGWRTRMKLLLVRFESFSDASVCVNRSERMHVPGIKNKNQWNTNLAVIEGEEKYQIVWWHLVLSKREKNVISIESLEIWLARLFLLFRIRMSFVAQNARWIFDARTHDATRDHNAPVESQRQTQAAGNLFWEKTFSSITMH